MILILRGEPGCPEGASRFFSDNLNRLQAGAERFIQI
jgi:hypothetical protein